MSSLDLREQRLTLWVRKLRWREGLRCPGCRGSHVVRNGHSQTSRQQFRCRECGMSFRDFTGTVFACTRMPLSQWIRILRAYRRGETIYGIAKQSGLFYKRVHQAVSRFKKALARGDLFEKRIWESTAVRTSRRP